MSNIMLEILDFVGIEQSGPLRKSFTFATDVVKYEGGTEQRNQLRQKPYRAWQLSYTMLPRENRDKLVELFQRASGKYRAFLYKDVDDDSGWCSFVATAGQTAFQTTKTYQLVSNESWVETIKYLQAGSTLVKVNNVTQAEGVDYTTEEETGVITFVAGLNVDDGVYIEYKFYFSVRFDIDTYDDVLNNPDLFEAGDVRIVEV